MGKKHSKEVNEYIKSLSDTELALGNSTLLIAILNKIPLALKLTLLKDEVEVAEVSLEEMKRRLTKIKPKAD